MMKEKENITAELSATGLRYNGGKIRWSLLSVPALRELINVLEFGAKKYSSWNWSKGLSWTDTYDSLQRHLQAWLTGEDHDPETGLSHIAHVMCNTMFLLHFIITRTGKDDRPLAQAKSNTKEENTLSDTERRYPADAITTRDTSPTSGTQGTDQVKLYDTVVERGLSDVQANVRPEVSRTKFIHGDADGEWWYLSDGRVGRYDYKGNRLV